MAKRKLSPRDEDVFYALMISNWDWSYSFQVGDQKWDPDEAFTDYRHLTISGTFTHPHGLVGTNAALSFVPSNDLLGKTAHRYKARPESVGQINLDRQTKVVNGIFSIPVDVLPALITMLIATRWKFLVLQGKKLRYGSASTRSYRFSENLSEDDFPPGQWNSPA